MVVVLASLAGIVQASSEEEAELDPVVQSSSVVVILSLMILFSVLFEHTKEKLLEETKPELLPVVNSLFGELTLLGFIGLALFLLDKLEIVSEFSAEFFGEEGYVGELCESVHMALFLVMLLFLGNVIGLVMFAQSASKLWKSWEERILDKSQLRKEYQDMLSTRQHW
jgi:hypothetical protein